MSLESLDINNNNSETASASMDLQADRCWISRLSLTSYRNYSSLTIEPDQRPIVLTGSNGSGKTNLMEAVSLYSSGTGLRRAAYADLAKMNSSTPWAISAKIHTAHGDFTIGTGLSPKSQMGERASRIVRVDGEPSSTNALSDYLHISWLTPAMDGLFTGPASERRRFLDKLISCFDPGYQKRINQFERAMRQRNKLLEADNIQPVLFEGLEVQMAEIGVSIAATRCEAIAQLAGTIYTRKESKNNTFPWAELSLEGDLETWLADYPAVEAEDLYIRALAQGRMRDRAAKRTLTGPHRSDLLVNHGPKAMPARYCSTGEQKALLVGLVLAHTELVKQINSGAAPIVLLDEIAAHFDEERRAGLFAEILDLGVQAWMTGTDSEMFASFGENAQFFTVDNGKVGP